MLTLKLLTQSELQTITRSVHSKFNCIAVKYNGTRQSIICICFILPWLKCPLVTSYYPIVSTQLSSIERGFYGLLNTNIIPRNVGPRISKGCFQQGALLASAGLRHAWGQPHAFYYMSYSLKLSQVQLLEKWCGDKMIKSSYNCVNLPLTQPQVAYQPIKNYTDPTVFLSENPLLKLKLNLGLVLSL